MDLSKYHIYLPCENQLLPGDHSHYIWTWVSIICTYTFPARTNYYLEIILTIKGLEELSHVDTPSLWEPTTTWRSFSLYMDLSKYHIHLLYEDQLLPGDHSHHIWTWVSITYTFPMRTNYYLEIILTVYGLEWVSQVHTPFLWKPTTTWRSFSLYMDLSKYDMHLPCENELLPGDHSHYIWTSVSITCTYTFPVRTSYYLDIIFTVYGLE